MKIDDFLELADDLLELADEIKALREIIDLVWDEVGPYGGEIELFSPTMKALRKYYNFDDGE